MKMHFLAGITVWLLSGAVLAAGPVVVQPTPVLLPSEPSAATLAVPVPEARAKTPALAKGKPGKKQAKVSSKTKTKPHPAKKLAKAKVRKSRS